MKSTMSMRKRIGAAGLCLALLCGLVFGVNFLPIDVKATEQNNTEPSKFEFSITDLVPYVNGKYTDSSENWMAIYEGGRHAKTPSATTIHAAIDKAFAVYYNHEDVHLQTQSGLYDSLDVIHKTAIGGVWINKWLHSVVDFSIPGGQREYMQTIDTLVPKNTSGQLIKLKNFETTFDFRFTHYCDELAAGRNPASVKGWDAALFAFRQQTTGKFVNAANSVNKEQAIICISPWGISVGAGDSINNAMYNTDAITFDQPSAKGYFTINIKAVNGDCWIKITDTDDGSVIFDNGGEPFAIDYDKEGTIAYGLGSCRSCIADIELIRLDDAGNPTDINGPIEEFEFSVTDLVPYSNGKYADSNQSWMSIQEGGQHASTASAQTVHAAVNNAFAMYYNHEDTYLKTTSGAYDSLSVAAKTTMGGLYLNKWLQSVVNWGVADGNRKYMCTINSMVPRDTNGDEIFLRNFETTFDFRFINYGDALGGGNTAKVKGWNAALIGFRQKTPGKFVDAANTVNKEQAVICISPWGISVGSGDDIDDAMYGTDAILFDAPLNKYYATINVKVVNGDCWVKITDTDNGNVIFDNDGAPFAIGYDKEGYISYGVGSCQNGIADISLSRLDDEGKLIDIDNPYRIDDGSGDAGDGAIDPENTVVYDFSDEAQLDNFDAWFLPEVTTATNAAIHVKGTSNNNWHTGTDGALRFKNNSLRKTANALKSCVTVRGDKWKNINTTADSAHYTNVGVAVLKTRKYENFILEVDYTSSAGWSQVGFGADATSGNDIFAGQPNGGFAFRDVASSVYYAAYDETAGTIDAFKASAKQKLGSASMTRRMRLIVSDKVAYVYLGKSTTPLRVELPADYDGGYIYFAANSNIAFFDNLKIVDLDAKPIKLSGLNGFDKEITLNRENGDMLSLPASANLTDEKGIRYNLPITWESDTYRSGKNGDYEFTAKLNLHNVTLLGDNKVTVHNVIGNDFDTEKSIKYYFDHANDLLDFDAYYSKKNVDGTWTATSGELVKAAHASDMWKAEGGKVTALYRGKGAADGAWTPALTTEHVATMILKDQNLVNYRIEMDYVHSQENWWYTYVVAGVQDPTKYFGVPGSSDMNPVRKGGGVYVHLDREGALQVQGSTTREYRWTVGDWRVDGSEQLFQELFDSKKSHHITVTVLEGGTLIVQVDNSEPITANLDSLVSYGGLAGFAGYGTDATISNFQITALDKDMNEIPLDDAARGWSSDEGPKLNSGWKPEEDWTFEWDDRYVTKF
ncbi:MAG: hypothetical protein J6L00_00075 [Clostridia bacterium]|nr:hypothetical protein [Clostridia bacterium]